MVLAERWRDQPLTAGIRPEHLRLTDEAGLAATVSDAEYLGHETLLHVRLAGLEATGSMLTARLPGLQTIHRGDAVRLIPDAAQWHWFDDSGIRL